MQAMSHDHVSYLSCPRCSGIALDRRSDGFRCSDCEEVFDLRTGAIAMTRARDFVGILREVKVLLDEDEHEVGAVGYGERRVFQLPPGVHSLSIGMDWGRSPLFEVEVRAGELVELEASARWRGFLWLVSLLTAFVLPARMFVIRPAARREESRFQGFWEGLRVIVGIVVFLGLVCLLLFLFASLLL
jgi:hypothetical protein